MRKEDIIYEGKDSIYVMSMLPVHVSMYVHTYLHCICTLMYMYDYSTMYVHVCTSMYVCTCSTKCIHSLHCMYASVHTMLCV